MQATPMLTQEASSSSSDTNPVNVPHDTNTYSAPGMRRSPLPGLVKGLALFLLGVAVTLGVNRLRPSPTLLTVNGVAISNAEFEHRCVVAAGGQVMQKMVLDELQIQFAKKQGVMPSQLDIDEKYAQAAKQDGFAKMLEDSHQTPEDIKRGIAVNLAQAATINKNVNATEADAKEFYKQNSDPHNPSARYYRPEAVQIAAIISDNENDIKSAMHDLASGQKFADVAMKYSKDASKQNGGLLPAIRRGATDPQKFPNMEQTLFKLQPGQQIDDVKLANAFWLIRCVNRQAEATVPYEKVKDECLTGAKLSKGLKTNGQAIQTEYTAFQKSADIKPIDPAYKNMNIVK